MSHNARTAVRRWALPVVLAALAGVCRPAVAFPIVRLAQSAPAVEQRDTGQYVPRPSFEPVPTVQVEQRAIQVEAPAPQPVGQMPFVLNYDIPTLRLKARFQLVGQGSGKKARQRRYQIPALSVPSWTPSPNVVLQGKQ